MTFRFYSWDSPPSMLTSLLHLAQVSNYCPPESVFPSGKMVVKPQLSLWSLRPCLQLHTWASHDGDRWSHKRIMVFWQLQKAEPPHGAITSWGAHPDFSEA